MHTHLWLIIVWIPTKNMVSTYISQNSAVYLARVITQAFFIFWGGNGSRTRQSNIFEGWSFCWNVSNLSYEWQSYNAIKLLTCIVNLMFFFQLDVSTSTWCVFNPLESIDNSTISCSLIRDWSWQCMLQTNSCHHSKQPLNTHIPIYWVGSKIATYSNFSKYC